MIVGVFHISMKRGDMKKLGLQPVGDSLESTVSNIFALWIFNITLLSFSLSSHQSPPKELLSFTATVISIGKIYKPNYLVVECHKYIPTSLNGIPWSWITSVNQLNKQLMSWISFIHSQLYEPTYQSEGEWWILVNDRSQKMEDPAPVERIELVVNSYVHIYNDTNFSFLSKEQARTKILSFCFSRITENSLFLVELDSICQT